MYHKCTFYLALLIGIYLTSAAKKQKGKRFAGKEQVKDVDHINLHYEGKVDTNETLDDEQRKYRYFKMFDENGDQRVDGLELWKGQIHEHKEKAESTGNPLPSESELEEIVDEILKDLDVDMNGFIDYAEFNKGFKL